MSDSAGPKDLPSKAVAGSEIPTNAGDSGRGVLPGANVTPGPQAETASIAPSHAGPTSSGPAKPGADGNTDGGKGQGFDQLATSLRHAYESTLEEAVPDSILNLLRQLD